jgi:hypothetical protein
MRMTVTPDRAIVTIEYWKTARNCLLRGIAAHTSLTELPALPGGLQ